MLSYDENTGKFYSNVVLNVISFNTYGKYVINGQIGTDAAEVFYTNNNMWTPSSQLKVGESIYDPLTNSWIPIVSIQYIPDTIKVYDVVGSSGNNFIVNGKYLADIITQ